MLGGRRPARKPSGRFIRKKDIVGSVSLRLTEVVREVEVRPNGEKVIACIAELNVYDDDYRLMYEVGFVDSQTGKTIFGYLAPGSMMNAAEAFRQFVILRRMLRLTRRPLNSQLLYDCWFAALLDTDPRNTTARRHGNRIASQIDFDLWRLLEMPVTRMPGPIRELWNRRPRV